MNKPLLDYVGCCPTCANIVIVHQWYDDKGNIRTIMKRQGTKEAGCK